MPHITWVRVHEYLIEAPSEFTKDKLNRYKSLEAYNFFILGHVQDIYYYNTNKNGMCFIQSFVLPSQRQGQNTTLYVMYALLCMLKAGY